MKSILNFRILCLGTCLGQCILVKIQYCTGTLAHNQSSTERRGDEKDIDSEQFQSLCMGSIYACMQYMRRNIATPLI